LHLDTLEVKLCISALLNPQRLIGLPNTPPNCCKQLRGFFFSGDYRFDCKTASTLQCPHRVEVDRIIMTR